MLKLWLKILPVLLFFLFSCQKEEIKNAAPATPENHAPPNFNVTVSNVGQHSAVIDWGSITDTDGDSLYRTISLGTMAIAQNLTIDEPFEIDNLSPSTTYSGTVSITDKKSDPVIASFTFTTKKYMTLFSKLITKYNDQYIDGFSIAKTTDGGYVVGSNYSDGSTWGTFILKYDSLGNEKWHTTLAGHPGIGIIQTKDNGYAIVGTKAMTKLNSDGVLQWEHLIPTWYQQYNGVIETDNSGYLVVGMMGGQTPARGSITKFDANGNLEWENFFDGNADVTLSGCNQIVKTSGNKYLIVGVHQKPTIDFELASAEIDDQGNINWIKNYPYKWETFYVGVTIKPADGGFVIGSISMEMDDTNHARVVKISPDGSLMWDHSFEYSPYETWCKAITVTTDGDILFVGGYTNFDHYETAIVVKLNSNGEFLWKKDYKPDYLDFIWDLRGIEQTADKGFVLVGVNARIWNDGGRGLWLMKTDDAADYQ